LAPQPGIRRTRQVGRPLADLLVPALGKTLAARGFAAADVVLAWQDIIGERLAEVSEPVLLEWPRGLRAGGARPDARKAATLVIRVEGAFGLEVQHLAPAILERVNAYFGWRCADKLVIRQGRVTRKAKPRASREAPDIRAVEKGRALTDGVDEGPLREALIGLGAEILAERAAATGRIGKEPGRPRRTRS
jgi:hypothetical protein